MCRYRLSRARPDSRMMLVSGYAHEMLRTVLDG